MTLKPCHLMTHLLFLALLFLPALPAAAAGPDADNACRPLPGADLRLCVSSLPGQKTQWALVPGNAVDIPMTGNRIYDFTLSPDGRWLALISANNGHPVFDLVDISSIARNGRATTKLSIDPYPGSLWFGEWEDENLSLGSSVPLEPGEPRLISGKAFEYHYRLHTADSSLQDRTISVVAPEPILFPSRYDATSQQWHCDCTLTEEDRKRAADNLSWLHLALPSARTLVLDVSVSRALAGKPAPEACVAALLAAIQLPNNVPIDIRYQQETLPQPLGLQIEMKVVSRP